MIFSRIIGRKNNVKQIFILVMLFSTPYEGFKTWDVNSNHFFNFAREKETSSEKETRNIAETSSDRVTGNIAETISDRETGNIAETISDRETGNIAETISDRETGNIAETSSDRETGNIPGDQYSSVEVGEYNTGTNISTKYVNKIFNEDHRSTSKSSDKTYSTEAKSRAGINLSSSTPDLSRHQEAKVLENTGQTTPNTNIDNSHQQKTLENFASNFIQVNEYYDDVVDKQQIESETTDKIPVEESTAVTTIDVTESQMVITPPNGLESDIDDPDDNIVHIVPCADREVPCVFEKTKTFTTSTPPPSFIKRFLHLLHII